MHCRGPAVKNVSMRKSVIIVCVPMAIHLKLIKVAELTQVCVRRNMWIQRNSTTHAKISHLVASLPTSRQQVVFALLVPSCQQVWNKLLTTCNNLVDIIRLVARLFQQIRYSYDITIVLQPCIVNIVTLYHDRIRLVRTTLPQV